FTDLVANLFLFIVLDVAVAIVVGVSDIDGVTINFLLAVWEPSVAVTVCVPATDAGTVNVAVKFPFGSAEVVARNAPSYDIVTVELDEKPVSETLTVVPAGPLVGSSDIAVFVTVNCAAAELDDVS